MKTITVPRAENEKGVGNLLAHVLTLRWAMKQDVLENLLAVVARHDAGQRLGAAEVDALTHRLNRSRDGLLSLAPGEGTQVDEYGNPMGQAYTRVGSVAVVPVGGVIAKYSSQVNGSSQPRGTSTEHVMRGLADAAADGKANSIMLLVDSPGGSVAGVSDLAEMIRQVGAVKPISSYAQDLAASAGLWITTQAKDRYANEGAMVGSLGVYTVLADVTKYHEQRGITLTLVSSGGLKGAMADGKVTEAAVEDVQREVNDYLGLFVRDVARGTGLSESHVKALADGRVHLAADALKMGLLTKVMDLPSAIAEMEGKYGGRVGHHPGATHKIGARSQNVDGGTKLATLAADVPRAAVAEAGGISKMAGGTPAPQDGGLGEPQKGAPMKGSQVLRNAAGGEGGGGGGGDGGSGAVATAPAPEKKPESKAEAVDVNAIAAKAAKAEGKRLAAIDAAARPFAHLQAVQILVDSAKEDTEMSVETFKAKMLDAISDGRKPLALSPSGDPGVGVGASGLEKLSEDLSAVMCLEFSTSVRDAVNAGGEKAAKVAAAIGLNGLNDLRAIRQRLSSSGVRPGSMKATFRAYLHAAGEKVPFDDLQLFAAMDRLNRRNLATHGTADFPLLLANIAGKTLQANFALAEPTWQYFCRKVTANDFKNIPMLRLSEAQRFKLRKEGAPNEYGTFNEKREQFAVEGYSTGIKYTQQMLVNDDLNSIQQMMDGISRSATQMPDEVFYALLQSGSSNNGPTMSDGLQLFDATANTGHGNLLSAAALSIASLGVADTAYRKRTGPGKDAVPLGLVPTLLLVPTALRITALELMNSDKKPTASAAQNEANVLKGAYQVVSSPRLTASATRWYISESQTPPFAAAFLGGQETPVITPNMGQTDYRNFTFDADVPGFGVAAINFETIMANPGA